MEVRQCRMRQSPGVGHLCRGERARSTATKEVHCHLNACATDLRFWCVGVGDEVVSQVHAHVQIALASAIPKHCCALDICLLVDVQLRLVKQGTRCTAEER